MLVSIYITLVLLAFVFFAWGMYNGSYGSRIVVRSGNTLIYDTKLAVTVIVFLISALLFGILALSSLSVTKDYCENQVTQTVLTGNTTAYTNQITCQTQRYPNQMLSALWTGLFLLAIIMPFVYIFKGE